MTLTKKHPIITCIYIYVCINYLPKKTKLVPALGPRERVNAGHGPGLLFGLQHGEGRGLAEELWNALSER